MVIDEQAFLLRVGVIDNLAYDVVLGDDFPFLLVDATPKTCAVLT